MFDHHDAHGLPTTCEMAERRLIDANTMIGSLGSQLDAVRRAYDRTVAELVRERDAARASVARLEQEAQQSRAVRVVVVFNRVRGRVHSITTSDAEAQQHVRELVAKHDGDPDAATMTVGLVDLPAPAADGAAEEPWDHEITLTEAGRAWLRAADDPASIRMAEIAEQRGEACCTGHVSPGGLSPCVNAEFNGCEPCCRNCPDDARMSELRAADATTADAGEGEVSGRG